MEPDQRHHSNQRNALLLGPDVFDENLCAILGLELADEARIPELARDAEVLATAHEGVALARLGSGRDAIRVEVLLFPTSDGDQSTQMCD